MEIYTPKNILITGGAGFIGANFIRYFLQAYPGIKIINLDALTYAGSLENLKNLPDNSQYHFVKGDIGDQALIFTLLRQYEIDTVIHFAAESHVDRSITGPAAFIETNIIGTFNLLEQTRQYWLNELKWTQKHCRFHHISTDEVYGTLTKTDKAFTETTPYQPNSPYSASKASSDHLARAYFHTYHLPVTTSNCSNNYGPYQHPEKFIPTIIHACLQQTMIPVYGNGSHIRDWLYVEDHCRAIDLIIRKGMPGQTYNVGANNEQDNLSIVKRICKLMDEYYPHHAPHEKLIEFVTDRPGHDWRYAIDNYKIATELGFTPNIDFTTGLIKTIAFYQSKN